MPLTMRYDRKAGTVTIIFRSWAGDDGIERPERRGQQQWTLMGP